MNSHKKFTAGIIMALTCVGVAVLLGIAAVATDLLGRNHNGLQPVTLIAFIAVGAAFMIAILIMRRGHLEALRELEANATKTKSDFILGKSRLESEAIVALKSRIKNGGISEIDLGGLALRSNFFKNHAAFSDDLLLALRTNKELKARIWLLDPRSKAIELREMAERERSQGLLQLACEETLETLRKMVISLWREQKHRRPGVVLVDKVAITHFIFRVDDEMVVSPYLQHGTGNSSPTIFLKKGDRWFDVYKSQFESCYSMHSDNLYPSDEELNESVRV